MQFESEFLKLKSASHGSFNYVLVTVATPPVIKGKDTRGTEQSLFLSFLYRDDDESRSRKLIRCQFL